MKGNKRWGRLPGQHRPLPFLKEKSTRSGISDQNDSPERAGEPQGTVASSCRSVGCPLPAAVAWGGAGAGRWGAGPEVAVPGVVARCDDSAQSS